MKTAVFSTRKFEKDYLITANNGIHELVFIEQKLSSDTVNLATGCEACCIFTGDDASAPILEKLKNTGINFLTTRSAGFNHIDVNEAQKLCIRVSRVAEYSPYAIAEHAVGMMLALNRHLITAHKRVMENNFSLDGLTGFDMNGKTVGIIGTGKIGGVAAKILNGFGCRILAYDKFENEDLKSQFNVSYTDLETLSKQADIITLHIPLTPDTIYLINESMISKMKKGVMLINTARGAIVNTSEIINGLKSGQIGSFGMDVYEGEGKLFFEDHSDEPLKDDVFARLLAFKNVLITGHQAFLTETALQNLAMTTIDNLSCFAAKVKSENELY